MSGGCTKHFRLVTYSWGKSMHLQDLSRWAPDMRVMMLPLLRLVATLVVIHHGAQHIQVLRGATISRSKWSNPYRWTCPGNITSKTEIDTDRCGLYWFITICNTTVRLISPIVFWGYEATLGCLGCPPKHKTGKHYDKLHNMYNIMIVYIYNFDLYIYIYIIIIYI